MELKEDDVKWVVNNLGELGVKIFDQFFFIYKGESYQGGEKWRPVFKREFGETCYAWDAKKINKNEITIYNDNRLYVIAPHVGNYICHLGESINEWSDI